MNVNKNTFNQNKSLYLSLRAQYLSGRPMTQSEEKVMWDCWHYLSHSGYKWFGIKKSQIRKTKSK